MGSHRPSSPGVLLPLCRCCNNKSTTAAQGDSDHGIFSGKMLPGPDGGPPDPPGSTAPKRGWRTPSVVLVWRKWMCSLETRILPSCPALATVITQLVASHSLTWVGQLTPEFELQVEYHATHPQPSILPRAVCKGSMKGNQPHIDCNHRIGYSPWGHKELDMTEQLTEQNEAHHGFPTKINQKCKGIGVGTVCAAVSN